jgi:hypothetical protein
MARLKLKQVLSNLHYDAQNDQLILSGSKVPTALLDWDEASGSWEEAFGDWDGTRRGIPDFVIYGETFVTSSAYLTGSLTIKGNLTVSGSFQTSSI